jgi:hypothetical protein
MFRRFMWQPLCFTGTCTIEKPVQFVPKRYVPSFLFLAKKTVKKLFEYTPYTSYFPLAMCVKGGLIMKIPGPIFVQGGGNFTPG